LGHIISQIVDSQQECGASLFRLKQSSSNRWSQLVAEVDQVVRTMPLWKLQTVGEERLAFLYENLDRGTRITLKPGVASYRAILLDVQKGICLHCQKSLPKQTQVDHFIPWSRFPADLGHNFVLVYSRCNNAKSDYVAAENHLAAWIERNRQRQGELQSRLLEAALPCELTATVQIAK
jgi:hypothetical protein